MRLRFPLSVEPVISTTFIRPHVGGEAMSVKADRPLKDGPLKDVIEATFVEVPRNGMASVGPRMDRMKAAPIETRRVGQEVE